MAESKHSLKDELFNKVTIGILADAIKGVYTSFDRASFYDKVMARLTHLIQIT